MPGMSPTESISPVAALHAADAMIERPFERRYPCGADRLREAVGTGVLPFHRGAQAVAARRRAGERRPHLVAFADSRDAASIGAT